MSDCRKNDRGKPVAELGYTASDQSILAIARHYCAAFAIPEGQNWIAAVSVALSDFGHEHGPHVAVGVLGALQTLRRIRMSMFRFNSAECVVCSAYATGHEILLMSAFRAVLRGRSDAALSHATLLCEGNDARTLVAALEVLAARLPNEEKAAAWTRILPVTPVQQIGI